MISNIHQIHQNILPLTHIGFKITYCSITPFDIHNKINITVNIFITIYILLVMIFPSVSLYWHHEAWVHKTRKFGHDTATTGWTPNCRFLTTTIFNFIKFYTSDFSVLYFLIGPGKIFYPRRYYFCSCRIFFSVIWYLY